MDVDAAQLRDRQIGRKSLLVDRPLPATIQRIAHNGTGLPRVEPMSPFTDLFIAGEEDADRAMRQVRSLDPCLSDFHDDGDPCLIVATQQRGPVGDDQRATDQPIQVGAVLGSQGKVPFSKPDWTSWVRIDHPWLHSLARSLWGGVEVGVEQHGGQLPWNRRRNRPPDAALSVVLNIFGAQFLQLPGK